MSADVYYKSLRKDTSEKIKFRKQSLNIKNKLVFSSSRVAKGKILLKKRIKLVEKFGFKKKKIMCKRKNFEMLPKLNLLIKSIDNKTLEKKKDEIIIERFLDVFKKTFEKIPDFEKISDCLSNFLFLPLKKKFIFFKKTDVNLIKNRISFREGYYNLEKACLKLKFRFQKYKKNFTKKLHEIKFKLELEEKKHFENRKQIDILLKNEILLKKQNFDLKRESLLNNFKLINLKKSEKEIKDENRDLLKTKEFHFLEKNYLEENLQITQKNYEIENNKILLLIQNKIDLTKKLENLQNKLLKKEYFQENLQRKINNIKKIIKNSENIEIFLSQKKVKESFNNLTNILLQKNSKTTKNEKKIKYFKTQNNSFKENLEKINNTLLSPFNYNDDLDIFRGKENFNFFNNVDKDVSDFLSENGIKGFSNQTQKIVLDIFGFLFNG